MAQALREETVTPADELRGLLVETEKRVTNLPGADPTGAAARQLLENMDRLAELWPQVEANGVDLRPEEGRYVTLQAQVRKQTGRILNGMAGQGGLAHVRRQRFGGQEAPWWWHLDDLRREDVKHNLRRGVLTVAVVAAVAAALVFAINKAFPTDPKVAAASTNLMSGQQMVQTGENVAQALPKFQEAASLTPNDPEPWLWVGVAEEKLGNTTEANQAFSRARSLLGNDTEFYVSRAPVYQGFNMLDQALADVNTALKADPSNIRAHYYLAGIYEMQGKLEQAINELETTSKLADAAQQPEMTAMARYRMGMLMQQVQMQQLGPAATATPTAAP
jgi:cytochrome c-type biogenesis protein CcmH/NrfG